MQAVDALRSRRLLALIVLALGLALLALPARSAEVRFSPCLLKHPLGVSSTSAECGTLAVPENPDAEGGRTIELHIARVPAVSRRKQPDPLFIIAGGPGGSAREFYTTAAGAFARIRRERDIILLDQRGTGSSNPLHCPYSEELLWAVRSNVVASETKRCLDSLMQHSDVSMYTTSVAVRDLDQVRAALGYERINLYGVSYGTRVAQHYVRRFGQNARTVILDGVVPPELVLGPTIALDAEAALVKVLERCAQDAPCRERFGDPLAAYRALRQSLEQKPVALDLPHPITGKPQKVEFGPMHFATVLRLGLYTSEQAALVPLEIDLAQNASNFTPLAGQFLSMMSSLEKTLAAGMHNTVVCAEDVPFYNDTLVDRARLRETFMGTVQVDTLEEICDFWPRGPMDPDFHEPLISDVPVLLLSGGNDPVTPASNGEHAMRTLKNSIHVVLQDMGHGQLAAPCVDRVMARFVASGSVKNLDVSCTREIRPMPFFTSLAAPPP